MKQTIATFILAMGFMLSSQAQVFNTATTLKKGQWNLGIQPALLLDADELILWVNGGVGLVSGVDLNLRLGLFEGDEYFGADVEFQMGKRFSLSAGAHSWGDLALDGTALLSFPITKGTYLYTGADLDVVLADDVIIPLWIPIGIEIGIKSKMSFILETDINVPDNASHMLGGGLNFYF